LPAVRLVSDLHHANDSSRASAMRNLLGERFEPILIEFVLNCYGFVPSPLGGEG
jgi:hypothetical protein